MFHVMKLILITSMFSIIFTNDKILMKLILITLMFSIIFTHDKKYRVHALFYFFINFFSYKNENFFL